MEKQNLKFTGRSKELVKELIDTLWRIKSQVLNKKEDIIVKDKVEVYDGRQSISLSGSHQDIADKIETVLRNTPAELIDQNSFKTRSLGLEKTLAPARSAVTTVKPSTKPVSATAVKPAPKPVSATAMRPVTKQASKATATPPAKPSFALLSHPAGFNLQDALQASNDYWKDNAVTFEQTAVNGSAVIKIKNSKTGLAENIPIKSFNAFAAGRKIGLSKINDNGSVTLTYAGHRKFTGKNGASMLTDGVNWPHLMQLPHMQPE